MNLPKFKNLYIPDQFTHINIVECQDCMHPLTNKISDIMFFIITGCGEYSDEQWTCKQCLASPTNIEIAKKYFRLKKLKELDDEST